MWQIIGGVLTVVVSVGVSLHLTNKRIQASRKDKLEEILRQHEGDIAKLKDRTDNYKEIEKIVYSQRTYNQSKQELVLDE